MEISVTEGPIAQVEGDTLVLVLFEGEKPAQHPWRDIDESLHGALSRALELGETTGKLYETTLVHTEGRIAAARVLLVGAGKRAEFSADRLRLIAGAAARFLAKKGGRRVIFAPAGGIEPAVWAQAVGEGVLLGLYEPNRYKTEKEEPPLQQLVLAAPAGARSLAEAAAARAKILGEATNYARRLVNEPANLMTPSTLAEEARAIAREHGLEVTVLDRAEMERLGMGALLAVAQGSEQPPFLIALRYQGLEGAPTLGLVGKGITFDSGGISLKPTERMHLMKDDMAGGAAVLAAMQAIAQLRPKINVLGVVPATENLPSGRAQRPGDVIRAMNGKTIEVINTDAEGRLILADALCWAQTQGVTHLVDVATLTGAALIALGDLATAILGQPQAWVDQVMAASRQAGEKMWQLPLWPEYKDLLKSQIADLANAGARQAGTIVGATFLREFVAENIPWAHLDIAATVQEEKPRAYRAEGPTGVAVRTLASLACALAEA